MSINKFKKMIIVSSFALIAISANAQDREEKDSLVSTGVRVNASELRTCDDAQEDSSYSGLAKVAYEQLVTQPCQGLLSTAAAFCKFSYQHPATALAMTATFALPVVAALLPEQTSSLWYPSFICAKAADTQQITYRVQGHSITNSFVSSDGGYNFPPYTGKSGYATASACSSASWSTWLYGDSPYTAGIGYSDANCRNQTFTSPAYYMAQPYYNMTLNDQQAPATYLTALCVQGTSAP